MMIIFLTYYSEFLLLKCFPFVDATVQHMMYGFGDDPNVSLL